MAQAFLMAIIQLEAGLFSLRLGHGAALTCHRHVIHSRAAASLPLKLPRCAVVFTQQHRFLESLKGGQLRLPAFQTFRLSVFFFQSFSSELHIRYIDKA